jgi:hypothetical protein
VEGRKSEEIKTAVALCDYAVSLERRVKGSFEHAIFMYALMKLGEYIGEDRYLLAVKAYCGELIRERPNLSKIKDTAGALVAYELFKKTGNGEYLSYVRSVINFWKSLPKSGGIAVGGTAFKVVYTENIFSCILDYLYHRDTGDTAGAESALLQPALYEERLSDKSDALFNHSSWGEAHLKLPVGRSYSARENLVALWTATFLAAEESYANGDLNGLIKRLTASLFKYKNTDESYRSFWINRKSSEASGLLTSPASAETTELKSGRDPAVAAYFGACCMKNAAGGIIDGGYRKIGEEAFLSAYRSLVMSGGAVHLPDVAKQSFLQNLAPAWFANVGMKEDDGFFGAAGVTLAALEYEKKTE